MAGHKKEDVTDRKYQIFISSTFNDLQDKRKKAVEVVVSRGHIPVDLSLFSARASTDLEVITQSIEQCQIYLVILGPRYGSLADSSSVNETFLFFSSYVRTSTMVLTLQIVSWSHDQRHHTEFAWVNLHSDPFPIIIIVILLLL